MAESLKSCPFCGASEIDIDYGAYTAGMLRGMWYIMCLKCGAEITASDMRGAFNAWNRRINNEQKTNTLHDF